MFRLEDKKDGNNDVNIDVTTRLKPSAYDGLVTRARYLKLLSDLGLSFSDIALKLNNSPPAVSMMFKRLVRDNLITQKRELTGKGINIVKNFLVVSNDVNIDNKKIFNKTDAIRSNDLMFSIKILSKPESFDYRKNNIVSMKVRDYKIVDLKNNYQEQFFVEEVLIKTTTEHILVMFKDFYAETEPEAIKKAMKALLDVIPKIENLYNIVLIKENYCNIAISKQHYALIHNELAKLYRTEFKGNTFKVYDDLDGRARLVIDFSLGIPEFEAVHYSKSPEDINKAQSFFKDMINKEHYLPSETKELLELNQAMLYEIGQGIIQTQTQLSGLIKSLNPKIPKDIIPKEKPDYFG